MYASPVDHVHYLKVRDEGFSDSLKTTTLYVVGMGRCFKDKYGTGAENLKLEKHFASLYGIRTKSIEEKSRNAPSRGAHVEVPALRPPRPRRQEQADDTTTRKNGFLKTCQCAAVSLARRQGDSGGGVVIVRGPGAFIRRSAQYTLFGILVATTICEAT